MTLWGKKVSMILNMESQWAPMLFGQIILFCILQKKEKSYRFWMTWGLVNLIYHFSSNCVTNMNWHWSSIGQPNILSHPKLMLLVKLMLQIGQDAQTNKLLIYSYLCILSWNITSMGMTRQNRDPRWYQPLTILSLSCKEPRTAFTVCRMTRSVG